MAKSKYAQGKKTTLTPTSIGLRVFHEPAAYWEYMTKAHPAQQAGLYQYGMPMGAFAITDACRDAWEIAVLFNPEFAEQTYIEKHCTIAHEALHVATAMWEMVGANIDAHHNDEVLAYTMNFVQKHLYKYLVHHKILEEK